MFYLEHWYLGINIVIAVGMQLSKYVIINIFICVWMLNTTVGVRPNSRPYH